MLEVRVLGRMEVLVDGAPVQHVELPEPEAHRLDSQREAIAESLRNLAALAG